MRGRASGVTRAVATTIARGAAACPVPGMSGAGASSGASGVVIPLPEITPMVARLFAGGTP